MSNLHLEGCGYSGLDAQTGIGACAHGCPIGTGFRWGIDRHAGAPPSWK